MVWYRSSVLLLDLFYLVGRLCYGKLPTTRGVANARYNYHFFHLGHT